MTTTKMRELAVRVLVLVTVLIMAFIASSTLTISNAYATTPEQEQEGWDTFYDSLKTYHIFQCAGDLGAPESGATEEQIEACADERLADDQRYLQPDLYPDDEDDDDH